jgi:hypothetical protein
VSSRRLVLALLPAIALAGSARGQQQTVDICELMPKSPAYERIQQTGCVGCRAVYANAEGRDDNVVTFWGLGPESAAQEQKRRDVRETTYGHPDPNVTSRDGLGLGDHGGVEMRREFPYAGSKQPWFHIHFSRGPWIVDGYGNADFLDTLRPILAELDQTLANTPLPNCGGVAPPPPPPAGAFGVVLDCQSNFDDPGLVVCHAEPTSPLAGAQIVWDWNLDGVAQSASDPDLRLQGVGPGSHTVTVVGRDVANQVSAAPQSVSFTKQPPAGGSVGPGDGGRGDGDGLPPWVPIAILIGATGTATVVGIGGVAGWVISRRRPPGRPGAPVAGVAPGLPPPESLPPPGSLPPPDRQRLPPPERLPPPVLPLGGLAGSVGSPLPAKPRLPPPEAPPIPPPPLPRPPASRPGERQEGDTWLTVEPPTVALHGNGENEAMVQVRAWKQVGGVPVDASREVWPSRTASDPAKLLLPGGPGAYRFSIKARHAGNMPFNGHVTVEANGPRGPLRPVVVAVQVSPVVLEVRIRAWKRGFREQQVVSTLPHMCSRVEGRVEGGDVETSASLAGASRGAGSRQVMGAHVTGSIQVDGRGWSPAVEVRTAPDGTFWFGLPASLVKAYGSGVASHPLSSEIELGLSDEVREALHLYAQGVDDWRRELAFIVADSGPILDTGDRCAGYPHTVLGQLRHRDEEDYERVMSALHRLRRGVLYALKYRRDYRFQRWLVDTATGDAMSSSLDLLTDFIPVAELFQNFMIGASQTFPIAKKVVTMPPGGVRRVLEAIADVIENWPLVGWIGSAFRGLLWLARKASNEVSDLMRLFYGGLIELVERRGFSSTHLLRLLDRDPGGYRLDAPSGLKGLRLGIEELCQLLDRLPVLMAKALAALAYTFLAACCIGLKLAGQGLALLPWSNAYKGWQGTVGEILEDWLGKLAGVLYENLGSKIERQVTDLVPTPGVAPKPPATVGRSAAEVVMDALGSLADFDARCAGELDEAYRRSAALLVAPAWQEQAAVVSRAARDEMARVQKFESHQETMEEVSRYAKLAVKVVQAALWAWGVLGKAALFAFTTIAGYAAKKVGVPGPIVEQAVDGTRAADITATLETAVDFVDFFTIRLPIWLKEVVVFGIVYNLATVHIRALYADGER